VFNSRNFSFVLGLSVLAYGLLIFVVPLALHFRDRDEWCPDSTPVDGQREDQTEQEVVEEREESPYANPDYILDPCRYVRLPHLLGLTLEDCDISRRMFVAILVGGVIGYERRSADRPAGIRTMCLVSLGSCFFTISSIMAFKSGTMAWDASRVTAALPSGVGFLGGALIWKGTVFVDDLETEKHQVHGLTTAASLWLSAALGVGAGGALYAVTVYATVLTLFMLRYGPTLYNMDEDDDDDEEEEERIGEPNGNIGGSTDTNDELMRRQLLEKHQRIMLLGQVRDSSEASLGLSSRHGDESNRPTEFSAGATPATTTESMRNSESNLRRRRRSSKKLCVPSIGS